MQKQNCQNCKNEFTIAAEDIDFYNMMDVPAPTWCPVCRYKRRAIWRNVRHLFRGTDASSGKEIFRQLHPDVTIPVYNLAYWNSDNWDALSYGQDYDFEKPFFTQWYELFQKVPFPALAVIGDNTGSEYCNQIDYPKNCYLVFNASNTEDSAYSFNVGEIKNSFDTTACFDSEYCYECTRTTKSHRTIASLQCEACADVWFSKNCTNCTDCIGCVNLRNKKYCIFNEQYTKEDYDEQKKLLGLDTYQGYSNVKQRAHAFWKKFPIKYMLGLRNQDVSGEDIRDSKNVHESYLVHKSENVKYSQDIPMGATNSYDYFVWGEYATKMYECTCAGMQTSDIKFSFDVWPNSQDIEYSATCRRVQNCFGCVGLKDKQYCILNKQYTKEEYEELLPKIKQHMLDMPYTDTKGRVYTYGEFFPIEFSPFAYNESALFDQFALSPEQAIAEGFLWRDMGHKAYEPTISIAEVAESIHDVPEDITKEILSCSDCEKAYRIIPSEYQLLKNLGVPIPRACIECRFKERQKNIPPPLFNTGACASEGCLETFLTAYDDTENIIYCEGCYKREVL
ncbi:MAG: hypothetical protein KBC22_02345 [Candidatus Pacebacteria bacterium]|nr:hypothetical protein [Candidatus Paceibacterota bacterium]